MNLQPILYLEQEIIAHILDNEAYFEEALKAGLTPDSFINDHAVELFRWIGERHKKREPVNLLTAMTHFDRMVDFLTCDRFDRRATAVSMEHYCRDLADFTYLRTAETALQSILNRISGQGSPDLAEHVRTEICDFAKKSEKRTLLEPFRKKLDEVTEEFAAELDRLTVDYDNGVCRGIPTGIKQIDERTGGLLPESLNLVGARTSLGKTTFGVNVAISALMNEKKVLFCTNEMSRLQIAEKFYSNRAMVNGTKMRKGNLDERERNKIAGAFRLNHHLPLWIDERSGKNLEHFVRTAWQMKRESGLDLIILDYLQLMRTNECKTDSVAYRLAYISAEIKQLARDLSIPIMALVQLNREVERLEEGTPPGLSHIKDSGSIEQDADVAIFIYKKPIEKPLIKGQKEEPEWQYAIHLAKNRPGLVGTFDIEADLAHNRFFD